MQFALDARTTFSKSKVREGQSFPIRRKAKIHSTKLPPDFFSSRLCSFSQRKTRAMPRDEIQTQRISRKIPVLLERQSVTRQSGIKRGCSTERCKQLYPDAMELLLGIIQNTREINRSIHKKSLELRRQSNLIGNPEGIAYELPPLKLKKGFSWN